MRLIENGNTKPVLLSKPPWLPRNLRHDIQLWGFETSPGQSTSCSHSKTKTICTGLTQNCCCLAPELYKFPVAALPKRLHLVSPIWSTAQY